ncbi:MAG: transposase [Pseudomonadota bacterium]|nr:transposase [Pseudomonadota bacterium]
MARLARVVVPGIPHHVTQRGNGRAKVFFSDEDYSLYRDLLFANCRESKVRCLAYVLMPNHVHLILVPKDRDGLRKVLSATHRAYAGMMNERKKKTGHFWQGRFGCVAMDGPHVEAALRYVLLNPVRARLVARPEDWRWSSAGSLLKGRADGLTDVDEVRHQFGNIRLLLGDMPELEMREMMLRRAETIGRPLGSETFLGKLERKLGRPLAPGKRGPKTKHKERKE